MTADPWSEDAQGLWQSQESVVTRLSGDDMRARAARWDHEFGRTHWIAYAGGGLFLAFFAWMLVVHEAPLQRVGAIIGLAAALYLLAVGRRIAGRGWVEEGTTCIRAYKAQLERRRQADMGAARTMLMAMTGCAFLSSPGPWMTWGLQFVAQLGAGVLAYVYASRQARRFQLRIEELTRIESDAAL